MPATRKRQYKHSSSSRKRARVVSLQSLPRSVRPEIKRRDITAATLTTFNTLQCRPFAQGDDNDDFIGSKVFLKSIDYSIDVDPAYGGSNRTTVLIPKDPTVAPTALAPNLRYNEDDFWILYDHMWSGKDTSSFRFKLPLNRLQTYNSIGSTVLSNLVYVVNNQSGTGLQTIATCRVYYTDP